ncbi:MAG: GNAT family N-acetyltransferase [Oscillospiraceae bacterium]|nr:GNAT family N-acetyltransferase [Oscillospiraceae bacterium]
MLTKTNIRNGLTVKRITEEADLQAALKLAENVFMQFEAPAFSERGVESFLMFLWGKRVREMFAEGSFAVWSCYAEKELAGMIALRDREHISLAFVRSDFHRQGIGRMLYAAAKAEALSHGTKRITVNASDYGIPFYRAMGFRETDMRLLTDGIQYTPMAAKI